MLRILQLYYEPLPSGQTTHVLSLTRALVQRGHTVTVVLPDFLKQTAADFLQTGGQIRPLPLKKLLWKPAAIVGLASLIRNNPFDIVHVHSQEAGITGRLVAKLAGAKRIVYTPQTIDIWRSGFQDLYRFTELALSHLTDRIISVNFRDQKRLTSWGIPTEKVVTIPNGIEVHPDLATRSLVELRAISGVPSGHPIVMQLGRLTAQKDPLAFVDGAALVIQELPDIHFVMIGEGPLHQEVLNRIHQYHLEDCFHLTGRVEHAAELLQLADLVSLTSRWEGLPYSLLEAMAYGKPFISTEVNGIHDLVEKVAGGRVIPPGDHVAWAKNVIELMKDPAERDQLGQRGRKHLIENYSLSTMIDRIETLYLDLL